MLDSIFLSNTKLLLCAMKESSQVSLSICCVILLLLCVLQSCCSVELEDDVEYFSGYCCCSSYPLLPCQHHHCLHCCSLCNTELMVSQWAPHSESSPLNNSLVDISKSGTQMETSSEQVLSISGHRPSTSRLMTRV